MVRKRINKESASGKAGTSKGRGPRPVFAAAAAIILVQLIFSPDFFPMFPRGALSVVVVAAAALLALSVAAAWLLRIGGAGGFKPLARRADGAAARALAFAASKRLFFAALLAGTLLGALGVFRVHRDSLPPMTLCPLQGASGAVVRLKGDPVPWGKDFYRADASVISFFSEHKAGDSRTEYSASGNMTLLIPAGVAEAALPGRSSIGRKPLYLANGAAIECKGSVSASKKAAGSSLLFRVSEIVSAEPPLSFADKAMAARARARLSLLKALYGWGDAAGLFLALCSGMREFMPDAASDAFRQAGLSHVLALSGMHLSILGGAVAFVFSKLAGRRLAGKLSLLALAFFLFFAGRSPSLLRAFLFTAALAAARRAGFRAELLPVLALVFCIHVLMRPADLYMLSFQLSYLATAGIFTAGAFFSEAFGGFIPPKLCGSLSASFGAQAAVFPLSMSVFGMFAPASTIATLILSAPISFFMISGIFCAALSFISPLLYSLCGLFMQAQYSLIFAVVSFFARFPVIAAGRNPLFAPFSVFALFALFFAAGGFVLRVLRQRRMPLHGIS